MTNKLAITVCLWLSGGSSVLCVGKPRPEVNESLNQQAAETDEHEAMSFLK